MHLYSIAHIGSRGIPGEPGGVERVVESVSVQQAVRGHSVRVYCSAKARYKGKEYRGVKLIHLPGIASKYLDTFVRSFLAILLEFFSPSDIIHIHGTGSAPFVLLAWLSRSKVVVTIHGLEWQRRKWNPLAKLYLRLSEWIAVRMAHKVIVVSESLKEYLDNHYAINVTCIPNGVECQDYQPPEQIKSLGLHKHNYILFLARLVPEKQCHLLVSAFKQLPDRKGLKLVIAGPTWHSKKYVEDLKAQIGDDPQVLLTGEVDDVTLKEMFSNCYAYVLPSEVEGMPLSVLEAMAFGACTVVSDIRPNADLVREAGIIFKTGSVEDLTEKLSQIIECPDLAESLRERAVCRVSTFYAWDSIVDKLDSSYLECLSKGGHKRGYTW